ncbi:MAG: cysteine--tRNA ligase [Legionellales bacterium]|nr:cysteine--tRNA ligase [Legionellales bacterium]
MLNIYNSLTKQKQPFTPLTPGQVKVYVCGMTVYDYCHLGHARSMVSFDVVVRYLRARGYQVQYVCNITDIDDKIIRRAHERQQSVTELTDYFIKAMHQDAQALHILPADAQPRATEHLPQIIELIETLMQRGVAYQASNGDVYFDVSQWADYGLLAHKDLAGQEAGARIGVVEVKRNALDFVLWKQAKPNEPAWDSPWGSGRPGWHIECSAMSMHCLGETFDIHGGGFDLQFPHHENEIAQSEAATGKPFAKWWMHVGYLQINRQKMSKSLGNFFTIRDVLAKYHPETVRYFLLSSHYRSQLNYSQANLQSAQQALERFYTCLRGLTVTVEQPIDLSSVSETYQQRFVAVMDDDFNTPEALAVLFDLTHEINRLRQVDQTQAKMLAHTLVQLGSVLGILQQDPNTFLQGALDEARQQQIEVLISERHAARDERDWAQADHIRTQLLDMGIELEDTAEGTIWRLHSQEDL